MYSGAIVVHTCGLSSGSPFMNKFYLSFIRSTSCAYRHPRLYVASPMKILRALSLCCVPVIDGERRTMGKERRGRKLPCVVSHRSTQHTQRFLFHRVLFVPVRRNMREILPSSAFLRQHRDQAHTSITHKKVRGRGRAPQHTGASSMSWRPGPQLSSRLSSPDFDERDLWTQRFITKTDDGELSLDVKVSSGVRNPLKNSEESKVFMLLWLLVTVYSRGDSRGWLILYHVF